MIFQNWKKLNINGYDLKKLIRVSDGLILFEKKEEPNYKGLKFTAQKAGSTIKLVKNGSAPDLTMLVSTDDGNNWSSYNIGDTITLANIGDYVCFKNSETITALGKTSSAYNGFIMSGKIAASGNIMSLLSPEFEDLIAIKSAYCFIKLFYGCASLTQAPELPATTIGDRCYY